MTKKLPFSKIDHVGILVKDLDKSIDYYQSLGIGPFQEIEMDTIVNKTMYGKTCDWQIRAAVAKLGAIKFELIQPLEKAHLMEEFLEKRGEGINHVAFAVEDLDKEVTNLINRGFKVILSAKRASGHGGVYFDTRQVGGTMIELIKWWPELVSSD